MKEDDAEELIKYMEEELNEGEKVKKIRFTRNGENQVVWLTRRYSKPTPKRSAKLVKTCIEDSLKQKEDWKQWKDLFDNQKEFYNLIIDTLKSELIELANKEAKIIIGLEKPKNSSHLKN